MGRIISLSSWSTMWQCHTYGPEVTGWKYGVPASAGTLQTGSAGLYTRRVGVGHGARRAVDQRPSHFALRVRTSPGYEMAVSLKPAPRAEGA